jgi:hypothetical protein
VIATRPCGNNSDFMEFCLASKLIVPIYDARSIDINYPVCRDDS